MLLEQDDYWGGYAVCHDNHTIYLKISKEKKKKKLFTNCTKYYSLPSVFTQDKDF